MTSKMSIGFLRQMFLEKYGSCMSLKQPIEILVTMTPEQYKDLNTDLLRSVNPLLLIEESEYIPYEPGSVLFTKINVPDLCDFIIEIGPEFEFGLLYKEDEPGDETLA